MSKRQTLKQLAEALDLSVATVSRALGGYEDISLRTRERVAAKAREIGYVPNSAGRMLVSGRSGFVGLVLSAHGSALFDSFIGQLVMGLGEGLAAHGCDLFLSIASEGQNELEVIKKLVDSGRADGFVLIRIAEDDERVHYLKSRGVPFVTHGRMADGNNDHAWLDTDGAAAFAEAFERLHDLGHRRFGLVTIAEQMNARLQREAGLARAIAARGDSSVELQVVRRSRDEMAAIRSDVAKLLSGPDRPTAVLGLFDELALIVIQEATRMGIAIPDELSVIGFDNVAAAALASPSLSTFDQDVSGSARTLARMIHQVMNPSGEPPAGILRIPKFVARASHGPAPGCQHQP
jgi:LacI family transcriptional regulator